MAKIKVHAGDFLKGRGDIVFGSFALRTKKHPTVGESIPLKKLTSVDIATEENVKKAGGTVGWGIVGGALLGPVGLLAGLIAGGRKKEVTLISSYSESQQKFLLWVISGPSRQC